MQLLVTADAEASFESVEQAGRRALQEVESQRGDLSKKDTELTDRLRARLSRISTDGEVLLLPHKVEVPGQELRHVAQELLGRSVCCLAVLRKETLICF